MHKKRAQEKKAQEKRHGKKGTGKMGTEKKGVSEKLGKRAQKEKKCFIGRLLLLFFNQHLDYSMYMCIILTKGSTCRNIPKL